MAGTQRTFAIIKPDAVAKKVADIKGCNRCDLDFYAWPEKKQNS